MRLNIKNFLPFVILAFGISCTTMTAQKHQKNHSAFSGRFNCPGYKGDDNKWNPSIDTIEHKVVNGVDVIIIDHQGDLFEKNGPYKKTVIISDGMWRYAPLYRNNTLYPIKVKSEIKENTLTWQAEYPDFIDNKGKKKPAGSGKGMFWIDKNGDKVTTGSHYTGQVKCKRLK